MQMYSAEPLARTNILKPNRKIINSFANITSLIVYIFLLRNPFRVFIPRKQWYAINRHIQQLNLMQNNRQIAAQKSFKISSFLIIFIFFQRYSRATTKHTEIKQTAFRHTRICQRSSSFIKLQFTTNIAEHTKTRTATAQATTKQQRAKQFNNKFTSLSFPLVRCSRRTSSHKFDLNFTKPKIK